MTPVSLSLPRFEYRTDDGIVALRDGFVVTFFIPQSNCPDGAAIGDAITAYLSLPGVPASLAALDDDGEPVARDPDAIAALARKAANAADEMANVVIQDPDDGGSGFSFAYFHLGQRRVIADAWPNAGAGLRFFFPSEYQGASVLLDLRGFADCLAERLNFSSGYVAPAFLYDDGICKGPAFDVIKGLSRRYLCLDIPDVVTDTFEVPSGVKGPYWGNYLSEMLVRELGGVDRFVSRLSPFDTRMQTLAPGKLALYLGSCPIAGDVNRREDVRAYGAAAELLSPAVREREVPYSGFSEEAMASWVHRFGRFDPPEEEEDSDPERTS